MVVSYESDLFLITAAFTFMSGLNHLWLWLLFIFRFRRLLFLYELLRLLLLLCLEPFAYKFAKFDDLFRLFVLIT